MLRHLEANGGNEKQAFSPEGIVKMNQNIVDLNDRHQHKPILKARVYEESASKFPVGERGNKKTKFVEAAKGTNLFFAVYEHETINKKTGEINKPRNFASIALDDAIRRRKQGQPVATVDSEGMQLSFVLSPNDLVYVPTQEELASGVIAMPLDCNRIYKMVSCDKKQVFFVPQSVAKTIYATDKNWAERFCGDGKIIVDEFGLGSRMSKSERTIGAEMIKNVCIPLKVNRLGEYTLLQNLSK
jgi:CRISPR-associated endonuclease Csn1